MQIWVATEGKYKFYYNRKNVGWVADGKTTRTTDTVKVGDGVYFKRTGTSSGDTTITISGKVDVADPTYPITIKKNSITFLANPWPVEMDIADLHSMVGAPQAGFTRAASDSVQVWIPTEGKYVFYYDRKNVGYVKDGTTTKVSYKIAPGEAFMFKRTGTSSGDTTITFTKPTGL